MAIRINRVYTRSGDGGETGLVGGSRVPKDDLRICAYGDVDELNAVIALVRAALTAPPYARRKAARRIDAELEEIQQELFDLGAELATPPQARHERMATVGEQQIEALEGRIDAMQPDLAPLTSFVLPGGGMAGALLHQARTVCRRSERSVTTLVRSGGAGANTARYLNRLSDLLFVQSRWLAAKTGHSEVLWRQRRTSEDPGRSSGAVAAKRVRGSAATAAKGKDPAIKDATGTATATAAAGAGRSKQAGSKAGSRARGGKATSRRNPGEKRK